MDDPVTNTVVAAAAAAAAEDDDDDDDDDDDLAVIGALPSMISVEEDASGAACST